MFTLLIAKRCTVFPSTNDKLEIKCKQLNVTAPN